MPCSSFFTFFDQIRMPTDDDLKAGKLTVVRQDLEVEDKTVEGSKDEGEEALKFSKPTYVEEDLGERIDRDYQLGQDFKDELIPMAYEYFLNIVEHDLDSGSDEEDGEEHKEGEPRIKKKNKVPDMGDCKN